MSLTVNTMAGAKILVDDYISDREGSKTQVVSLTINDGVTTRTAFMNKAQLKVLVTELEKRLNG